MPNTGVISQNISRQIQGKLSTWKSQSENGVTLVKLETYQFSKISSLKKKNWWKHTTMRSVIVVVSIADPKILIVQKVMNQEGKELKQIPEIQNNAKKLVSGTTNLANSKNIQSIRME